MSDIPVGSPPVPPGRHAAPGGWYPDPLDRGRERYWDGWQWSRTTRELEGAPGGAGAAGSYAQPYGGAHPGPDQTGGSYRGGQPGYGQPPQNPQPGNSPLGQYPQGPYPPGPYPQGPYPQGPGGQRQTPGQQAAWTVDGVPLAGYGWRMLAVLLDSIIVSIVAVIPAIGIYSRLIDAMAVILRESVQAAQNGQPAPPMPATTSLISTSDMLMLTVITVVVSMLYHVAFLRWKAATPGKLICRLRIVPVDRGRDRSVLPWRTVLVRAAIWVLPGIHSYLLVFKVLDALFPAWQPKRQALHDLVAQTQVVKLG